jgi:hypothetical protein
MSGVPKQLDDLLKASVEAHYLIAGALILILVVMVIYLLSRKEKMSPTATMYKVSQDTPGVGWTSQENRERAEGGKPAGPAQAGPKEGSAAWAVLHSDEFACDKREPVGDDAWSWMVSHKNDAESLRGGLSESALSALGQGQAASVAKRR